MKQKVTKSVPLVKRLKIAMHIRDIMYAVVVVCIFGDILLASAYEYNDSLPMKTGIIATVILCTLMGVGAYVAQVFEVFIKRLQESIEREETMYAKKLAEERAIAKRRAERCQRDTYLYLTGTYD